MNYSSTSTASRSACGQTRSRLHRKMEELLAAANIRIDGDRPWDMKLEEQGVLERVALHGSLGLGEAYMDGHWKADMLDVFFERLLRARVDRRIKPLGWFLPILSERLFNRQSVRRAWQVGQAHYDLGNDFYQAMLDPSMSYTCCYWKRAGYLADAQVAKLDLICRKLRLEPGMRMLDVGCGWGGLMAHAAEHYGVRCVGVTISAEQAAYATRRCSHLPVEVRLQDYRAVDERFDRIASVGMFEHVGKSNYRTFMRVVHRCLDDGGIFLLHTIGKNERQGRTDPWIERYIFPNGELPSLGLVGDALDGLFVAEDVHNFGADYDKTLMAWHANFENAWPRFRARLGDRFYRQWRYYLLSCAGAFRARDLQLWQWTLSKGGLPGGCARVD